jgi:hypothetical protein
MRDFIKDCWWMVILVLLWGVANYKAGEQERIEAKERLEKIVDERLKHRCAELNVQEK